MEGVNCLLMGKNWRLEDKGTDGTRELEMRRESSPIGDGDETGDRKLETNFDLGVVGNT